MFGSYLQSAFRNAIRNPLYAIVNIVGLALGLACCTLIVLFVLDELSYDSHWAEADNIYRINSVTKDAGGFEGKEFAALPGTFQPLLKSEFPDVRVAARLHRIDPLIIRDDTRFYENEFYFADPEIFQIFDMSFVAGNAETALSEPNTVVLAESIAAKYFSDEDPIGQTINYGGTVDLKVTGIIEDLPRNTHLSAELISNMETFRAVLGPMVPLMFEHWGNSAFHTYVLLEEGASFEALEAQLPDFFLRHAGEKRAETSTQAVRPITEIHLWSEAESELKPTGDIDLVYMFGAIAIATLVIAIVNFANLTTARGALRAREVGVRKVAGATRGSIAAQFLFETALFVIASVFLAMFLVSDVLPWFNSFTDKDVTLGILMETEFLIPAIGLGIAITLLAGAWPAAFLSGFRPVAAIKGDSGEGDAGAVRKSLVVIQFAVSVGLAISTAVVYQQMTFARSLPLGYQKEDVVVLKYNFRRPEQAAAYETLVTEWASHPDVVSVTGAFTVPTDELNTGEALVPPGGDPENPVRVRVNYVNYDYFRTFDIDLLAGRSFSRERSGETFTIPGLTPPDQLSDQAAIVINESAVSLFGFATPEDAVGQQIQYPAGSNLSLTLNIVGVTSDIYYTSVHSPIMPQAYFLSPLSLQIAIRLSGNNREAALAHVDDTWNSHVPSYPISRTFLEDKFDALYQNEDRAFALFTVFTIIAFAISGLGLFSLAAFTISRRTKEIGVRKVLGATVPRIVTLMTWDFTKLVLVASVIATPLAWYAMQQWLQGFAYRTPISPMIFGGAILAAFAIATFVVLFHSLRAANTRPALSLRDE